MGLMMGRETHIRMPLADFTRLKVQLGVTCADIFSLMLEHMQRHGAGAVGRPGHGLGMQLTEFPTLTPFDQTLLQPGMVLTLEPGYSFASDKMMVHEENIVVRDNGAKLLSKRAAKHMPVIDRVT